MNLKAIVKQEMGKTESLILNYPWENKRAYGMWLAQTYHMVCHSTRLVALAGAYCNLEQNSLHARFVDHSREERGHEKLCISDLYEIAHRIEDFPEMVQSASMYQVQYYWIQFKSPIAFFGYTLALECLAEYFGRAVYEKVCDFHGAPAAKFLKVHSEADLEHTEAAYQQLQKLNPAELELVNQNLQLSAGLYRSMLSDAPLLSEAGLAKRSA